MRPPLEDRTPMSNPREPVGPAAAPGAPTWKPIRTSRELAEQVFSQYEHGRPIGITEVQSPPGRPAGEKTYLVLLAGTEPGKMAQGNTVLTDLAYYGRHGGEYQKSILEAMRKQIPPGSHVILAGHSLGGMAAQDVVAGEAFRKAGYRADAVVTFGSPQTGPEQPGTHYARFTNAGDPVPAYAGPAAPFTAGKQTVVSDIAPGPTGYVRAKEHAKASLALGQTDVSAHLKYPHLRDLDRYDGLGFSRDQGGSCVLQLSEKARASYPAPRDAELYQAAAREFAASPGIFVGREALEYGARMGATLGANLHDAFDSARQRVREDLQRLYSERPRDGAAEGDRHAPDRPARHPRATDGTGPPAPPADPSTPAATGAEGRIRIRPGQGAPNPTAADAAHPYRPGAAFVDQIGKRAREDVREAAEHLETARKAGEEISQARFHPENLGQFVEAAGKRLPELPGRVAGEARKQWDLGVRGVGETIEKAGKMVDPNVAPADKERIAADCVYDKAKEKATGAADAGLAHAGARIGASAQHAVRSAAEHLRIEQGMRAAADAHRHRGVHTQKHGPMDVTYYPGSDHCRVEIRHEGKAVLQGRLVGQYDYGNAHQGPLAGKQGAGPDAAFSGFRYLEVKVDEHAPMGRIGGTHEVADGASRAQWFNFDVAGSAVQGRSEGAVRHTWPDYRNPHDSLSPNEKSHVYEVRLKPDSVVCVGEASYMGQGYEGGRLQVYSPKHLNDPAPLVGEPRPLPDAARDQRHGQAQVRNQEWQQRPPHRSEKLDAADEAARRAGEKARQVLEAENRKAHQAERERRGESPPHPGEKGANETQPTRERPETAARRHADSGQRDQPSHRNPHPTHGTSPGEGKPDLPRNRSASAEREAQPTSTKADGHRAGEPHADSRKPGGHKAGEPHADSRKPDGHKAGEPHADSRKPGGHKAGEPHADSRKPGGHKAGEPHADSRKPDGHKAGERKAETGRGEDRHAEPQQTRRGEPERRRGQARQDESHDSDPRESKDHGTAKPREGVRRDPADRPAQERAETDRNPDSPERVGPRRDDRSRPPKAEPTPADRPMSAPRRTSRVTAEGNPEAASPGAEPPSDRGGTGRESPEPARQTPTSSHPGADDRERPGAGGSESPAPAGGDRAPTPRSPMIRGGVEMSEAEAARKRDGEPGTDDPDRADSAPGQKSRARRDRDRDRIDAPREEREPLSDGSIRRVGCRDQRKSSEVQRPSEKNDRTSEPERPRDP